MKDLNAGRMLVVLVWTALMVSSCIRKESPPPGILSKAEMADLMMQMYMGEARALTWAIPRDSAYKLFVPFQDSILRKKGLADSVVLKSYQYYVDRPTELESIFDAMIDSLSLKEQRLRQVPPTVR